MSDTISAAVPAEVAMAFDDAAVARAQAVAEAKGAKLDADTVRDMLTAATEPDEPDIAVSLGMVDAGRKTWLANPAASVHVLLPALYRAMEQRRRDEGGE